jgi:hypothetical protein
MSMNNSPLHVLNVERTVGFYSFGESSRLSATS